MSLFDRLTARQMQIVVRRCERDLTTEEIGRELGVSPQTVKNHITPMIAKFENKGMNFICCEWGRELGRNEGK